VAKVEVYTASYCPYCIRAKSLLKRKGVAFDEINGRIVGGYDELRALEAAGRLDKLLSEPG